MIEPSESAQLEILEAVYYPSQVPISPGSLTLLGFLFDRVHFPGVCMPPPEAVDDKWLKEEIRRIVSLGFKDIETRQLINCMVFAQQMKYVRDFCVFDGELGKPTKLDELTPQVAHALEEMIFGPAPENFIRTSTLDFVKAVQGSDAMELQISGPGPVAYPANALLYASRNKMLLINDDPSLPVPGIPGQAKNNAKLLATILTIESVKLVLPKIRVLSPEQLMNFRAETFEYVRPFRLSMLRMARDLNAAISSEMTLAQVQEQARFLVETSVYPELQELEKIVHDPGKAWYRRAVDLAKSAPEIVTSFSTMPKNLAIAMLLGKVAGALADVRDEQQDREHKLGRSGLHFLLKLKDQSP